MGDAEGAGHRGVEALMRLIDVINKILMVRGEWTEKIPADNPFGYEWAIFSITKA